MWLRSQNKKVLINVAIFSIKENKISVRTDGAPGSYSIVGTYKTSERAIEVLDDIQFEIKNYSQNDNVYIMPEE